jgi:hypothetical protein
MGRAILESGAISVSLWPIRDGMSLSLQQIQALASDDAVDAGRKLAQPLRWSALGRNDDALWGECQGSSLYQTRVALPDLAVKCSCPSRRLPCKHALALMFLSVLHPELLPASPTPPEWVTNWLTTRHDPLPRKLRSGAPPDLEGQARRAEKRAARVRAGADGLDLWMNDLIRTGLANVSDEEPWLEQAARLVDAQAPGLASRVRRLAFLPRDAPDFHARLCEELGELALLTHAFRRLDALPLPLAADVRAAVGWTLDRDEVATSGERLTDQWAVVGQSVSEDERFRTQRTWLLGRHTSRFALILQFAAAEATFPERLPPGHQLNAELAFWPSAHPLRAIILNREAEPTPLTDRLAGLGDIEALLDRQAAALARQPWLDRIPIALGDVVPVVDDQSFFVVDRAGQALPLAGPSWRLLALSGGVEIDLFGDWNGRTLRPLGVVAEGRFHTVGEGA